MLTMDFAAPASLIMASLGLLSAGLAPLVRALRPAWMPAWRAFPRRRGYQPTDGYTAQVLRELLEEKN